MTRKLYVARIVPVTKEPQDVLASGGEVRERWTEWSFHHQRSDPSSIPVLWGHRDKDVQVGNLVQLATQGGWWIASFTLGTSLVAGLAEDRTRVGSPVSIEFEEILTQPSRTELEWLSRDIARLTGLSLGIRRAAFPGAQVVAIVPLPKTQARAHQDEPGILRRDFGRIVGVR